MLIHLKLSILLSSWYVDFREVYCFPQIFQKAANEPNFTHLYSKLCVILCERARNFEPENHNTVSP